VMHSAAGGQFHRELASEESAEGGAVQGRRQEIYMRGADENFCTLANC
jgi:hypothetical protein